MNISEKYEWSKNNYLVSTDREKLDVQAIHRYLTRSTWAKGIPLDIVSASVENSLNFGVYHKENQIGFARLITDYATFAMFMCLKNTRVKGSEDGLWNAYIVTPFLIGSAG